MKKLAAKIEVGDIICFYENKTPLSQEVLEVVTTTACPSLVLFKLAGRSLCKSKSDWVEVEESNRDNTPLQSLTPAFVFDGVSID